MNMSSSQMFRLFLVSITLVLLLCTLPTWAGGEEEEPSWPYWRGPNRDSVSAETDWDP